MELIFNCSEQLANLAAIKMADIIGPSGFGPCQAIGVASGSKPTDRLLAVVIYHEYQPKHATCQVSIVSWHPSWARRGVIKSLLSVPFEQYGVKKLWAAIASDNERSLRFNKGIGFKREAALCHQFGKDRHAVMTYMMDKTFKQLYQRAGKNSYLLKDLKRV